MPGFAGFVAADADAICDVFEGKTDILCVGIFMLGNTTVSV